MMPLSHHITKAEYAYHADPNNEAAARALIDIYQHAGRRDDALRIGLRLLLHLDTLNRLPEPETQRLMQSLAAAPLAVPVRRAVSRRQMFGACIALSLCGAGVFAYQQRADSREFHQRQGDLFATQAAHLYDAGNFDEAYEKGQAAHNHYLLANSIVADGRNCLVIGKIFQAWGKFSKAQNWVNAGADKIRQAGMPLEAANALNTAANLNIKLGKYDLAQEQNEQSFQIRLAEGDEPGVIECLRERGTLFAERDDDLDAANAWSEAELRARNANKSNMIASLEYLRGLYAIRRGKSDNGLLESSFSYWQQVKHPLWQANVRLRQAESDILARQFAAAQSKLQFCRNIYTAKKSQIGLADCSAAECLMALATGDTALANIKIKAALEVYEEAGLVFRSRHIDQVISHLRRQ